MTELPDVATHLEALGIPYPEGLAFLPSNIFNAGSKEELYYPKLIPDLERALEGQNLPVERLTPSSERAYVESRGVEWILPVLAVGHALFTTPNLLSIALNIVSSYLYDRMKRVKAEAPVRMSLVKRSATGTEWLTYEGPVEGLRVLSNWQPAARVPEANVEPGS